MATPSPFFRRNIGHRITHNRFAPTYMCDWILTENLGTYMTLPSATYAAQRQFDKILREHHSQQRYGGRFINELGIFQRAWITAYVEPPIGSGGPMIEVPVSELLIHPVDRDNDIMTPPMGGEKENDLFKEDANTAPVVKLPFDTGSSAASTHEIIMDGEHQIKANTSISRERRASWTQADLPYPRKRDDAPFRRSEDRPYDQIMHFGGEASSSGTP